MDLYSALMSGVSEKDLRENFEQQLAEARMKRQATRDKEDNKSQARRAAAKALSRYAAALLGDIPENSEEVFNKVFLMMEREIERDMPKEKAPAPINGDAEILKAFLKTL